MTSKETLLYCCTALPLLLLTVGGFTALCQEIEVTEGVIYPLEEILGTHVCLDDDIFFVSNLSPYQRASLVPNLHRVRIDGTGFQTLLTPEEASRFAGVPLICDPVHRRLAMVHTAMSDSFEEGQADQLALMDVDTGEIRVVVDENRKIFQPVFSPEGDAIAFFSTHRAIHALQHQPECEGYVLDVVDLGTGQVNRLSPPSIDPFPGAPPAWSPDGEEIAFSAWYQIEEGHALHTVRRDGSGMRTLFAPGRYGTVGYIVWPSPSTILFTQAHSRVMQIGLEDQEPETLFETGLISSLRVSPDRRRLLVEETREIGQPATEAIYSLNGERTDAESASSELVYHGTWCLRSERAGASAH